MTFGAAVNSLFTNNQVRKPRGVVTINGTPVPWESWEVDNNTHHTADKFRVELAINALPFNADAIYLTSQPAILVEILAGFPSSLEVFTTDGLTSLILGQVDHLDYEPSNGKIILSGRDLTSHFIDNKTTEKFQNLTSSQIASQLAQRRGLNPVVTSTPLRVGKYYEIDHARLTEEKSEWDLLTYLAQEENFNVFVKGNNLYFQSGPQSNGTPYVINYNPGFFGAPDSSNTIHIQFSRDLTLAKDISVNVKSWNLKQKKGFIKTAKATHTKNAKISGAAKSIGGPKIYDLVVPNLTPEQTSKRAQTLLNEFSKHEMKVRIEMPADNVLTTQNIIQMVGTGTIFDQTYYPTSITRRMSVSEGYIMSIHAKNNSSDMETTV